MGLEITAKCCDPMVGKGGHIIQRNIFPEVANCILIDFNNF